MKICFTFNYIRKVKKFSFFSTIILFSSCDFIQHVKGIVLDSKTKLAIDSAYIQNADKNFDHTYTDREGKFELKSIGSGFSHPMRVAITKKSYEIKLVEIDNNINSILDTIYLQKIK